MIDLLVIILSTYFLGKRVAAKGYDAYIWRFRHVMVCIFIETLVGGISVLITENLLIASLSGIVALAGIVLYRYQKVMELEPRKNEMP